MGDRISVLLNGELHQSDRTQIIFEKPATEGVARYLTYRNLFSGIVKEQNETTIVDLGHFSIVPPQKISSGEQVRLCIMPQDIKIIKEDQPIRGGLRKNTFQVEIVSILPLPDYFMVYAKLPESPKEFDFEIKVPRYLERKYNLYNRKKIRVAIPEKQIVLVS
ncbi:ATP-binding cassette domain-containing protein [Desulfosarcina ovata]|nr:hypothetical protein [Desulfosarcina ovata]